MQPPTDIQRHAWDAWIAEAKRFHALGEVPRDQFAWIEPRLRGRDGLSILDVGCGDGWACARLVAHGTVVGTDLAPGAIERARERVPGATFIAGDFMTLDLGHDFDLVVTLEVLSHVADQPAFVAKLASHLRSGGELLLATQNGPVLSRTTWVPPSPPGRLRRWVSRDELRALLEPHFIIDEMATLTPSGNVGLLRVLNSRIAVRVMGSLIGAAAWTRFRERLGFGWTIMVRAHKR
jgi:2-polyprenyl-3-methyl-5-hydroxy-6-metoxy-1,4-benzoquinol methylase